MREFLAQNLKNSQAQWEQAVCDLAKQGGMVAWPVVEVQLSVPSQGPSAGHTASVFVSSDVLAIGPFSDVLRIPLGPIVAQTIANLSGSFLPTRKIATDVWHTAKDRGLTVKPLPATAFGQQNKGPNLQQYADHNTAVERQLNDADATIGQLVSGHKKDVVISNAWRPGKVVIFGWFNLDGSRIQPLSNVHDDRYADYSHGIRLVSPVMLVDGLPRKLEEVLQSPLLSGLVSDEGPIKTTRYPTPGSTPAGIPGDGNDVGHLQDPRVSAASIGSKGWTALVELATHHPRSYV